MSTPVRSPRCPEAPDVHVDGSPGEGGDLMIPESTTGTNVEKCDEAKIIKDRISQEVEEAY